MNLIISALDIISSLTILTSIVFLAYGWRRALYPSVNFFFTGLLTLILIYTLCNVCEWTWINNIFDDYGDLVGILIPLMWGFFFYAFLQQSTEQELKNRDIQFKELFDEAPIGYHEIDAKGRITRVNRTELILLGYSEKEMLGKPVWDFTDKPEISRRSVMDKIKGLTPPGHQFERIYRHKDGTLLPVLIEDKILKDEKGRIVGIRSTIQDITERKITIEKLKESEEFSRALFEYNPIETIVVNDKGEIINFNLAQKKSNYRMPRIGDVMYKDYAGKHEIDMYAELMRCIRSGKTKTFPEQRYLGSFLSITITPFPKGAIITSQDITERKRAEEEIKKLGSAVEQSIDGIVISDLESKITYVNNAFAQIHGYSPEEMVGMKIEELHNNEQNDELKKWIKQIEAQGQWAGEISHIRKDGTLFPTHTSVNLLRDEKGNPTGVLATCRDISQRKFVEEALRSSEERYRELWENAPIAYHILDKNGIIISVNRTEAKMLGYKLNEMLGKPIFDFIVPEQRAEAKKRFLLKISGEHIPEAEDRIYLSKDGKKIHVTIDDVLEYDREGKIASIRTTMLDISDRKKMEEEREKSFRQLKKAFEETITALASAVETRDLYTAGHQRRVTQLACAMAKEMELPDDQIDAIRMAGLIHDIGKISVPAEILGKPSKLTTIEMDLIKTHPKVGYDILKNVGFPWPVAKIVLQHHERINGSGYPQGLKEKDILLETKILSVADVVEAMASYRPYREALGIDAALEEISKNRGKLYDPRVVDICLKLFKEKRFKFTDNPAVPSVPSVNI